MRGHPAFKPAVLTAALVLVLASVGFNLVVAGYDLHIRKKPVYAEGNLRVRSLPAEFPSWERLGAERPPLSKEAAEELGTDNYLSREYVESSPPAGRDPHVVELHIAYYTGVIDAVPHVPERCFVGAGVTQTGGTELVRIPLDMSGLIVDPDAPAGLFDGLPVYMGRSPTMFRRIRLPAGIEDLTMTASKYESHEGRGFFAGYFFVTNGRVVASAADVRPMAFRLKDDYAYYCKVQFTSPTVSSPEELAEVAGSMLDEMFPDIMRRMPDWVVVKTEGPWEPSSSDEGGGG